MTKLEINMRNSYIGLTDQIFESAELNNIAAQYKLSDDYLLGKIEDVISVAGDKELNLYDSCILELFDMQGSPDERLIGDHSRWGYIRNALLHAKRNDKICKAIASGWDRTSIKYIMDEKLGGLIKDAVVEGGTICEHNDEVHDLYPLDNSEDLYEIEKNIFKEAAKQELMLAIQGNVSKSFNSIYFEANELTRGNLREHFIVTRRGNPTTKDIYYTIEHSEFDTSGFTYENEKITFEPTIKNTEILHFILSEAYTLQSVRFAEEEGDRISIIRDNEDKKDFESKDINKFAEKTIPNGWYYTINSDFCMDFAIAGSTRLTKEYAANRLGEIIFPRKKIIVTHTGDNISDVFMGPNSIFFPKNDSDAENYCKDNNIKHISVKNTIEYLLIMTAITDMAIRDKIPTRPTHTIKT